MAVDEKNSGDVPDDAEDREKAISGDLVGSAAIGGVAADRPESESAENTSSSAAPDMDDELPEFEPLTPELVEEEAIRGDFMLRWAAIFLALLFGFSKLTDTRTLVHIRSGEQMRASGFLPARVDTFSFTADGATVSNVSWLYDNLLSLLWSVGGANALTLFKAAVAAVIAYVLVNISVPGMPTWWNSICAVFAIVACSGDFVATTDLMTLLGMVLVLSMLHSWREGTARGLAWKMPLLIAVWCNLDPRAWLGALAIVLFAVGTAVGRRRLAQEREQSTGSDTSPAMDDTASRGSLWPCAVACVLALLLNPFPLNSLFSATSIYSVEYPAMQDQRPLSSRLAGVSFDGRVDYFPLIAPDAFLLFDHTQIAGLAVLLTALVMLVIARDARDAGYLFLLLGMLLPAVIASHELPVAALVAAVVAGTTAQRWYRRNYTLQYSVDAKELLFSRGGRALTVFAMAFLGFCVVAGRLPGNTPVGWGFDRETQTTIDTLGSQLADIDEEARILHTRIDQGDILIWHGRKSLIDSRLLPFGRPSDPDSLIARHKRILFQLLRTPPPPEDDDQRRKQEETKAAADEDLRELAVTHAMPKLSPPGEPDYESVRKLIVNPEWVLVSLGPSAAFFEKVPAALSAQERIRKAPAFGKMAFQDAKAVPVSRPDFAREPSFYQRYVYRERPYRDQYLRLADHYVSFSQGQVQSIEQAVTLLSMNTMAIRNINQSLYLEPQNSDAFRLLGLAYQQLDYMETLLAGDIGDVGRQDMRFLQSVMAYRQALKGNPDDPLCWQMLFQQYMRKQKVDLAFECLERWLPMQENRARSVDDEAFLKDMFDTQRQLQDNIAEQEERLAEFLLTVEETTDPEQKSLQIADTAASLAQGGFSRRALTLLQENDDLLQANPAAKVLKGQLLLECGELEEGFTVLNQLGSVARDQPATFAGIRWHQPAAISNLSIADYTTAIDFWTAQLDEVELAAKAPEVTRNLLITLPLTAEVSLLPNAMLPQWPVGHMSSMVLPSQGIANARAEPRFLIAMCHIEEGNMQSARLILRGILSECGNSRYRPLAAQYLVLIDEKAMEFINQNTLNDWEPIEFESETAAPAAAGGDADAGAEAAKPEPTATDPEPASAPKP